MHTPFFAALQFLSIFPVQRTFDAPTVARSLLYFPLVGAVIGLLLLCVGALPIAAPLLAAALVLLAWVIITGGLHLDGLADSADAWAAGRGDKQRALKVMKDPLCGPFAVVMLVLLLLCKFAALSVLLESGELTLLLVAPVLARGAVLALYQTTPYIRENGLGQCYVDASDRRYIWAVIAISALLCALLAGVWAVLIAVLAVSALRWLMLQQIGGMTGDTMGATIELVEVCVLFGVLV